MDNFWQVLQHQFPSVAKVILSGYDGGWEAKKLPPAGLAEIAERSPASLHVSISCLHQTANYLGRRTRVSWHRKLSLSSARTEWEVVTSDWIRTTVLPPPKTFRGPVGAYCRIGHHRSRLVQRKWVIRILLIQAIEAYYLEDGHRHAFVHTRDAVLCSSCRASGLPTRSMPGMIEILRRRVNNYAQFSRSTLMKYHA